MKKLIIIFALLLSFSMCLIAKPKVLKTFSFIPAELQGIWYSLSFSEDEGKTEDNTVRPIFSVTSSLISSAAYTDVIISVEKVKFKEGIGYLLYSKDETTVYLVMFYPETKDLPIVYVFWDSVEQFRSCINIVKI